VFIREHVESREIPAIDFSTVVGLVMAFIACGRAAPSPIT
jgi:hypothetical protein